MGIKSGVKKVGRKAILDVDVSKACSTVLAPEAPMALRLQSNLLYVSRRPTNPHLRELTTVQIRHRKGLRYAVRLCSDRRRECSQPHAYHVARKIPGELAAARRTGTTKVSPRTSLSGIVHLTTYRADVLQDDPAFMPGLDLMNMDLDDLNFGQLNIDSTTLHEDLQSSLSPQSSQMTNASQHSIGGLMLPPSASSFAGGPVGGSDLFGLRANSESGTNVQPARMLEDDLFIVGDDGTMNFDDVPVRQSSAGAHANLPAESNDGGDQHADINMASTANLEIEVRTDIHQPDQAQDDGFVPLHDDLDIEIPTAELQHETSSETATAPLRPKRVKKVHLIPMDFTTQLSNSQLSGRNNTYLADMRAACHHKQNTRLAALAKKNAEYWVLGDSDAFGKGMRGPLDMFSGARLFEAFTGIKLASGGQKRTREDGDAPTQTGRRVRSRGGDSVEEEIGRGMSDDNFPLMNDDTIEQGREAPTPLDERQASSIFPWNQSAGSRRPTDAHGTSASMGATQLDKAVRRASRLTSASPLTGRGMMGIAPELDDYEPGLESDYAIGGMTGNEEFELFGAAAQVDTQTAEQSQWQRATLVGESANFLDFVRTAIENADEHRVADDDEEEDRSGSVEFENLLPPHQSQIVAAQGFLHILTLGSRQMIQVDQEESFGPISLRMMAV